MTIKIKTYVDLDGDGQWAWLEELEVLLAVEAVEAQTETWTVADTWIGKVKIGVAGVDELWSHAAEGAHEGTAEATASWVEARTATAEAANGAGRHVTASDGGAWLESQEVARVALALTALVVAASLSADRRDADGHDGGDE